MPCWKKEIRSGIPMGIFLEYEIYSLSEKRISGRKQKEKTSSEFQQKLNDINAKKKLRRYINTNFTHKDYYVTLSFAKKPSRDDAKRELSNYLERIRRRRMRLGLDKIKYIAVIEGHEKRYHIHLIINNMPAGDFFSLWRKGNVHISNLDLNGEYEGLIRYMLKEKKKPNARRWLQSKNLMKYEETKSTIERMELFAPVKAPPGYEILECVMTDSVFTGVGRYISMKKKSDDLSKIKQPRGCKVEKG